MNKKRLFIFKQALALFMVLCSVWGWGQTFTQVTDLAGLTTGEYLIVGDGTNDGLMINTTSSGPIINYSAISNPGASITSGFTNDNIFTITVTGTTSKTITIYNASVGYVSWGNTGTGTGNHAGFYNSAPTNKEEWSATVATSLWTLANVATPARMFQWNPATPRFAAYTSAQTKLKLYKKEASSPCDPLTLTAGTTNATTTQVASGGSTNLSLTGVSTGSGLSYQWQSSPNGTTWTNISGATNATYSATNITAATYYRASVTCGNTTVYSTPVQITLSYCLAGVSSGPYETISNFTFGSINNSSNATVGYEDFTSKSTDIQKGMAIPFSIAIDQPYAQDQILIWIDLNHDYDFNDAGEQVFTGSITGVSPITGSIMVPNTATNGNTRLRIRLFDTESNPTATACGTTEYGQVEDYTVNIVAASQTITADTTSLTTFTYMEGSGPSAQQSFTVMGASLTDPITVTAPANWEVSATSGSGFAGTATLPAAGGTVYARLISGLPVNASYSGNITLSSTGATTVSVAVSGSVTAPISATSNNTSFGTVSVAGNVITATPAAGYTYASPAYTIVSGSATVSQNGNEFTVTATSATTVQINFAPMPTYTLSLMKDGSAYSDANFPFTSYAGNTITLPTLANCDSFTFAGWDANSSTTSAPTFAGGATYTMTATNVTLYAVYSKTAGSPEEWTKVNALGDIVAGTYVILNGAYYLPNSSTTTAAPAAIEISAAGVSVSGNTLTGTIPNGMQWVFTGSNAAMTIKSPNGNTLYNNASNNGTRIGGTADSWAFEIYNTGFAMKDANSSRYTAVYTAGPDWRSYTTRNFTNYATNSGILDLYKKSGGSTTTYTTTPNCTPAAVTWSGTAWSNTNGPDATTPAIIDGDYNAGEFTAQSLTVNAGKTLTVNNYVSVGNVTNNGNIIVADGANFVQTGTFTAGAGSSFKVRKDTKPVKRLAYINWSSPMAGSTQTLKQFSFGKNPDGSNQSATGTVDNRFFTYNNNTFVSISPTNTFEAGAGYQIRTPNDFTTTPQVFHGQFEGTTPNTGAISVPHNGIITGDYVLLGNPYPSAISISDFLTHNPGTQGTFYIWNSGAEMIDNAYGGGNYNTYAPNIGSVPAGSINGYIPVGQGFFIKRGAAIAPFVFTNAMRQTTEDGVFSKAATADKFWLELTAPSGSKPQMLIGFNAAATPGYDAGFDAALFGTNADALYSEVNGTKLVIDAHGTFSSDDTFALKADLSAAGNYTIGILKSEGVFASGQQIWLKDQLTGTTTLISEQPYAFTADAGTLANRFVLQFKPGGALATDSAVKSDISIYSAGSEVHAKSSENITSLHVYDMSGRMIAKAPAAQKEIVLNVAYKGVVLVKAQLANGTVKTTKLMLK